MIFFLLRIFLLCSGVVLKSILNFCTWNVFAPSCVIPCSMLFLRTLRAVMTEMMENIPTTMPSIVRTDRSLLPRIAASAIRRLSLKLAGFRKCDIIRFGPRVVKEVK